jgi:phosphatidylglycerol:prolipoprotein diacylglycerol transferase
VKPEIELGPLTLQSFGLMMGLGFVAAGVLASKRLKELGKPQDWAYEMVFAALIGGIVGARLWSVIQNWDEAKDDLVGSLFSGTGLVFYGGLLGGAVAVLLWAVWRKDLGLWLPDLAAPSLAIAYAIGRLGCQLAGDGDYGIPTSLPWGMSYPDGTVPTTDDVHPTPIYEFLVMSGVAWYLWSRRNKMPPGGLFALYLVLAGAERFLIELIRRNADVVGPFSLAQFVALASVAIGSIWLWRLRGTPVPTAPPAPARG